MLIRRLAAMQQSDVHIESSFAKSKDERSWMSDASWGIWIVLFFLLAFGVFWWRGLKSTEEYIHRVSDLDVDGAITRVYEGEYEILVRAELELEQIQHLHPKTRVAPPAFFSRESNGRPTNILLYSGYPEWKPDLPTNYEGLLFLHGCTEERAWHGLLDPATGVLWLNVYGESSTFDERCLPLVFDCRGDSLPEVGRGTVVRRVQPPEKSYGASKSVCIAPERAGRSERAFHEEHCALPRIVDGGVEAHGRRVEGRL